MVLPASDLLIVWLVVKIIAVNSHSPPNVYLKTSLTRHPDTAISRVDGVEGTLALQSRPYSNIQWHPRRSHRENSLRLPTHWEGMDMDSLLNVATVAAPRINSCHPSAFVMCPVFFQPEVHWVEQPTHKRTVSSTALPSDSPGSPKSAPLSSLLLV